MKYAWITGTSSGLGKAFAEQLLKAGWTVTGISRSCTIEHPAYRHIALDLSAPGAPQQINFTTEQPAEELLLINNAGTLGDIAWLGNASDISIEQGLYLNLITPAILTNRILAQTTASAARRTVLNISSGAAQNPYDGWSTYCSSKAGLDMLAETAALERKLAGDARTRIFSIAPGILGTAMQEKIRSADKAHFSRLDKFAELFAEGKLADVRITAAKLLEMLQHPEQFPETRYDIRDL